MMDHCRHNLFLNNHILDHCYRIGIVAVIGIVAIVIIIILVVVIHHRIRHRHGC